MIHQSLCNTESSKAYDISQSKACRSAYLMGQYLHTHEYDSNRSRVHNIARIINVLSRGIVYGESHLRIKQRKMRLLLRSTEYPFARTKVFVFCPEVLCQNPSLPKSSFLQTYPDFLITIVVEEQFCLNFLRQGDFVSISINPCIEKKNSFSSQKGMFWDGNVFIYNMIPFILAMKPAFFVIKYGISLLKMFVLLPM